MPSLIVDASVAVKWFFEEEGSEAARAILDQEDALFAPELIIAEVGNATWKRRLRNQIDVEQALFVAERLPRLFGRLISLTELASDAIRISTSLPHPAYDCFYLALAERERLSLVTADDRLLAAAQKLGTVDVRSL